MNEHQESHPDEEAIAAHLRGEGLEEVARHLPTCPSCSRLARGIARWQGLFADIREASEPQDAPGPVQERLLEVADAHLKARPRRLVWVAAAAALLLVVALHGARRSFQKPALPPVVPVAQAVPGPALKTRGAGVELLLSADARLEGSRLGAGACLAVVQGNGLELEIGPWKVRASAAEFIARIEPESAEHQASIWMQEAWAGERVRASLAVLSGRVEVTAAGEAGKAGPLVLKAGELFVEGRGRTVLDAARAASLRDAMFLPSAAPQVPRAVGNAVRLENGTGWRVLSEGGRPSACLLGVPGEPYEASLRLKAASKPFALGLSAWVGGQGVLLPLEAPRLWDGEWHCLRLLVTPNWVSVTLDGTLLKRSPRAGFRSNPEAGLEGFGAAVWGGELEVESLEVQPLR